jgi:hypothetical protein
VVGGGGGSQLVGVGGHNRPHQRVVVVIALFMKKVISVRVTFVAGVAALCCVDSLHCG